MDNQILPYIFSCSRCSFVWIYITKGKKRLSKLPFYATRVWSSGIYRLLVCLILWTCLSNLRAGPLSFHAWVFYTLNLSTQNKPYAFGSWFIPDVLPSDVTVCVCVCAYLVCHSHMFELQLFDFSPPFSPIPSCSHSQSLRVHGWVSLSFRQSVPGRLSEYFLPTERQAGTCTLTECVCASVSLCMDAVSDMRLQSFCVCDVPGGADSSGV